MEKNNFNIRFAEKKDIKVLLELIKELAEYEKMLDQFFATEEDYEEILFEKKIAEVLLGEFNGEIIGYVVFFHNFSTFLGKSGIYLEDLYVKPEFRGKRFGKKLLKKLAKIAVERNCARLEWTCLDWNTPSIKFYKSIGAEQLDSWSIFRMKENELLEFAKED